MTYKPFNRRVAVAGDKLVLAKLPAIRLSFRFMGHGSTLVADLEPDCIPDYHPRSMILRQCDVLMVTTEPRSHPQPERAGNGQIAG